MPVRPTTVHELTHVWQFDNLDYQRMQRESGLLLIEGHATWTEVECLKRRNLAPEYWHRTAARTDVYGEGYRAVALMVKQANAAEPFALLLRTYGRSDGS